ncbi:class I SAM-dependent methyltransferase [Roseovarius salinarum]|uniref:class I SAM-dependent methyltransferase n=1 Tax=Roseovarius salinarum TaxID=1981892 RepID=UPI000C33F057|nr:SAM-dependent methyltransferase [Roseovarius salinarum]
MTPLAGILAGRIRADGPITLADYMAECLLHPEHGYYAAREALGASGDFTTAPEISQMFGELLGLCLAQAWLDQGAPAPFVLAEAGPGRGTLMRDALRATRAVPGFHEALALHLVEASEAMRTRQTDTLGRDDMTWHASVDALPDDRPLFLLANEFFDALPVRQMHRAGRMWRESCVGLREGALFPGLSDPKPIPALDDRLADTQDGDIVEIRPAGQAAAASIGRRIADRGGAALIVDYGDWRTLGDTLQAVAGHAPVDPFDNPGEADLTAHVDFEALARAAPCAHSRLTPQGVFLERLGITARAQRLARGLSGAALDEHVAAHRRLTHPDEMGRLFKVLAFYPHGANPPPGLEP